MRIRSKSRQARLSIRRAAGAHFAQGGFALLEILIGGLILGLCVVSLYSAYSFGFSLMRLSQENVRADQILLQKMETIRTYPWPQTAPGSGIIPTNFTTQFTTGPGAAGVVYNGTIAIADNPVSESYSNTLRQLTVSLNWNSGGVLRNRSMTTFISQNGIQTL
jgi:hypothetical protein